MRKLTGIASDVPGIAYGLRAEVPAPPSTVPSPAPAPAPPPGPDVPAPEITDPIPPESPSPVREPTMPTPMARSLRRSSTSNSNQGVRVGTRRALLPQGSAILH